MPVRTLKRLRRGPSMPGNRGSFGWTVPIAILVMVAGGCTDHESPAAPEAFRTDASADAMAPQGFVLSTTGVPMIRLGEVGWQAFAINDGGLVVGTAEVPPFPGTRFFPWTWRNGEETLLEAPIGLQGDAFGVNARGQVIGQLYDEDGIGRAFLWTKGLVVDLDPRSAGSFPEAINDRGQIIGARSTPAGYRAFLWENGVITDLGRPPGAESAFLSDINNRGQVVGSSDGTAVLWQDGEWRDLGAPPGWSSTGAFAINDGGQVLARGGFSDPPGFLIWRNDRWTHVSADGTDLVGNDLNNRGQVVGTMRISSRSSHAFLWDKGETIDLGTLPGGSNSVARAINDRGQVVGFSSHPDHPFENAVMWITN